MLQGHNNDGVIYSHHSGPSLNPSSRKLMESMSGLSLEERVNWNIVEYSKLLRGEESAVAAPSSFETPDSLDYHSDGRRNERELQTGVVWELQEFVFEGCVFQHNQQGDVGESTKYGIVTVDMPYDIGTFENCTFYNNSYGDAEDGVRTKHWLCRNGPGEFRTNVDVPYLFFYTAWICYKLRNGFQTYYD